MGPPRIQPPPRRPQQPPEVITPAVPPPPPVQAATPEISPGTATATVLSHIEGSRPSETAVEGRTSGPRQRFEEQIRRFEQARETNPREARRILMGILPGLAGELGRNLRTDAEGRSQDLIALRNFFRQGIQFLRAHRSPEFRTRELEQESDRLEQWERGVRATERELGLIRDQLRTQLQLPAGAEPTSQHLDQARVLIQISRALGDDTELLQDVSLYRDLVREIPAESIRPQHLVNHWGRVLRYAAGIQRRAAAESELATSSGALVAEARRSFINALTPLVSPAVAGSAQEMVTRFSNGAAPELADRLNFAGAIGFFISSAGDPQVALHQALEVVAERQAAGDGPLAQEIYRSVTQSVSSLPAEQRRLARMQLAATAVQLSEDGFFARYADSLSRTLQEELTGTALSPAEREMNAASQAISILWLRAHGQAIEPSETLLERLRAGGPMLSQLAGAIDPVEPTGSGEVIDAILAAAPRTSAERMVQDLARRAAELRPTIGRGGPDPFDAVLQLGIFETAPHLRLAQLESNRSGLQRLAQTRELSGADIEAGRRLMRTVEQERNRLTESLVEDPELRTAQLESILQADEAILAFRQRAGVPRGGDAADFKDATGVVEARIEQDRQALRTQRDYVVATARDESRPRAHRLAAYRIAARLDERLGLGNERARDLTAWQDLLGETAAGELSAADRYNDFGVIFSGLNTLRQREYDERSLDIAHTSTWDTVEEVASFVPGLLGSFLQARRLAETLTTARPERLTVDTQDLQSRMEAAQRELTGLLPNILPGEDRVAETTRRVIQLRLERLTESSPGAEALQAADELASQLSARGLRAFAEEPAGQRAMLEELTTQAENHLAEGHLSAAILAEPGRTVRLPLSPEEQRARETAQRRGEPEPPPRRLSEFVGVEGGRLSFTAAFQALGFEARAQILNSVLRAAEVGEYRATAAAETDPVRRDFYQARVALAEGNFLLARDELNSFLAATDERRDDPGIRELREEAIRLNRPFLNQTLDEMERVDAELQAQRDQNPEGFLYNAERNQRLFEQLRRLVNDESLQLWSLDAALTYLHTQAEADYRRQIAETEVPEATRRFLANPMIREGSGVHLGAYMLGSLGVHRGTGLWDLNNPEMPTVGAAQRSFLQHPEQEFPNVPTATLAGGTLYFEDRHIMEREGIMRVRIGPQGGTIVMPVSGQPRTYHFGPAQGERYVLLRGIDIIPQRGLEVPPYRTLWEAERDGRVDPTSTSHHAPFSRSVFRMPMTSGPYSYDPEIRAVLAFHSPESIHRRVQSPEAGRQAVLDLAQALRGRHGSYTEAGRLLEELMQPELDRIQISDADLGRVSREVQADRQRIRGEVHERVETYRRQGVVIPQTRVDEMIAEAEDLEYVTRVRALEFTRLQDAVESGRISDPIIRTAWQEYNDMMDPLGEWLNFSDSTVDRIVDEVVINTVLMVASGGIAGRAAAGAGQIFTRMAGRWLAREGVNVLGRYAAEWAGGAGARRLAGRAILWTMGAAARESGERIAARLAIWLVEKTTEGIAFDLAMRGFQTGRTLGGSFLGGLASGEDIDAAMRQAIQAMLADQGGLFAEPDELAAGIGHSILMMYGIGIGNVAFRRVAGGALSRRAARLEREATRAGRDAERLTARAERLEGGTSRLEAQLRERARQATERAQQLERSGDGAAARAARERASRLSQRADQLASGGEDAALQVARRQAERARGAGGRASTVTDQALAREAREAAGALRRQQRAYQAAGNGVRAVSWTGQLTSEAFVFMGMSGVPEGQEPGQVFFENVFTILRLRLGGRIMGHMGGHEAQQRARVERFERIVQERWGYRSGSPESLMVVQGMVARAGRGEAISEIEASVSQRSREDLSGVVHTVLDVPRTTADGQPNPAHSRMVASVLAYQQFRQSSPGRRGQAVSVDQLAREVGRMRLRVDRLIRRLGLTRGEQRLPELSDTLLMAALQSGSAGRRTITVLLAQAEDESLGSALRGRAEAVVGEGNLATPEGQQVLTDLLTWSQTNPAAFRSVDPSGPLRESLRELGADTATPEGRGLAALLLRHAMPGARNSAELQRRLATLSEDIGMLLTLESLGTGEAAAGNRQALMRWALESGMSSEAIVALARQIFNGERRLQFVGEGSSRHVEVSELSGSARERRRAQIQERALQLPERFYTPEARAAARGDYSERELPRVMSTMLSIDPNTAEGRRLMPTLTRYLQRHPGPDFARRIGEMGQAANRRLEAMGLSEGPATVGLRITLLEAALAPEGRTASRVETLSQARPQLEAQANALYGPGGAASLPGQRLMASLYSRHLESRDGVSIAQGVPSELMQALSRWRVSATESRDQRLRGNLVNFLGPVLGNLRETRLWIAGLNRSIDRLIRLEGMDAAARNRVLQWAVGRFRNPMELETFIGEVLEGHRGIRADQRGNVDEVHFETEQAIQERRREVRARLGAEAEGAPSVEAAGEPGTGGEGRQQGGSPEEQPVLQEAARASQPEPRRVVTEQSGVRARTPRERAVPPPVPADAQLQQLARSFGITDRTLLDQVSMRDFNQRLSEGDGREANLRRMRQAMDAADRDLDRAAAEGTMNPELRQALRERIFLGVVEGRVTAEQARRLVTEEEVSFFLHRVLQRGEQGMALDSFHRQLTAEFQAGRIDRTEALARVFDYSARHLAQANGISPSPELLRALSALHRGGQVRINRLTQANLHGIFIDPAVQRALESLPEGRREAVRQALFAEILRGGTEGRHLSEAAAIERIEAVREARLEVRDFGFASAQRVGPRLADRPPPPEGGAPEVVVPRPPRVPDAEAIMELHRQDVERQEETLRYIEAMAQGFREEATRHPSLEAELNRVADQIDRDRVVMRGMGQAAEAAKARIVEAVPRFEELRSISDARLREGLLWRFVSVYDAAGAPPPAEDRAERATGGQRPLRRAQAPREAPGLPDPVGREAELMEEIGREAEGRGTRAEPAMAARIQLRVLDREVAGERDEARLLNLVGRRSLILRDYAHARDVHEAQALRQSRQAMAQGIIDQLSGLTMAQASAIREDLIRRWEGLPRQGEGSWMHDAQALTDAARAGRLEHRLENARMVFEIRSEAEAARDEVREPAERAAEDWGDMGLGDFDPAAGMELRDIPPEARPLTIRQGRELLARYRPATSEPTAVESQTVPLDPGVAPARARQGSSSMAELGRWANPARQMGALGTLAREANLQLTQLGEHIERLESLWYRIEVMPPADAAERAQLQGEYDQLRTEVETGLATLRRFEFASRQLTARMQGYDEIHLALIEMMHPTGSPGRAEPVLDVEGGLVFEFAEAELARAGDQVMRLIDGVPTPERAEDFARPVEPEAAQRPARQVSMGEMQVMARTPADIPEIAGRLRRQFGNPVGDSIAEGHRTLIFETVPGTRVQVRIRVQTPEEASAAAEPLQHPQHRMHRHLASQAMERAEAAGYRRGSPDFLRFSQMLLRAWTDRLETEARGGSPAHQELSDFTAGQWEGGRRLPSLAEAARHDATTRGPRTRAARDAVQALEELPTLLATRAILLADRGAHPESRDGHPVPEYAAYTERLSQLNRQIDGRVRALQIYFRVRGETASQEQAPVVDLSSARQRRQTREAETPQAPGLSEAASAVPPREIVPGVRPASEPRPSEPPGVGEMARSGLRAEQLGRIRPDTLPPESAPTPLPPRVRSLAQRIARREGFEGGQFLRYLRQIGPERLERILEAGGSETARAHSEANLASLLIQGFRTPEGSPLRRFVSEASAQEIGLIIRCSPATFARVMEDSIFGRLAEGRAAPHELLDSIRSITDPELAEILLGLAVLREYRVPSQTEGGNRLLAMFGIDRAHHETFPWTRADLIARAELYFRVAQTRQRFSEEILRAVGPERRAAVEAFMETLWRTVGSQDVQDTILPYTPHGWGHSLEVMEASLRIFESSPALQRRLTQQFGSAEVARVMVQFIGLFHDAGYGCLQPHEHKGVHAERSGIIFARDFATHMERVFGIRPNDPRFQEIFLAIERHGADKYHEADYMEASDTDNPLLFTVRLADNLDLTTDRLREVQTHPILMQALREMHTLTETEPYQVANREGRRRLVDGVRQRFVREVFPEHFSGEDLEVVRNLIVQLNETAFPHFAGCAWALGYSVEEGPGGRLIVNIDINGDPEAGGRVREGEMRILNALYQVHRTYRAVQSLYYRGQRVEVHYTTDFRAADAAGREFSIEQPRRERYTLSRLTLAGLRPPPAEPQPPPAPEHVVIGETPFIVERETQTDGEVYVFRNDAGQDQTLRIMVPRGEASAEQIAGRLEALSPRVLAALAATPRRIAFSDLAQIRQIGEEFFIFRVEESTEEHQVYQIMELGPEFSPIRVRIPNTDAARQELDRNLTSFSPELRRLLGQYGARFTTPLSASSLAQLRRLAPTDPVALHNPARDILQLALSSSDAALRYTIQGTQIPTEAGMQTGGMGAGWQLENTGEIVGVGSGRTVFRGIATGPDGRQVPVAIVTLTHAMGGGLAREARNLQAFMEAGIGEVQLYGSVNLGGRQALVVNLAAGEYYNDFRRMPRDVAREAAPRFARDIARAAAHGIHIGGDTQFLLGRDENGQPRVQWIDLETLGPITPEQTRALQARLGREPNLQDWYEVMLGNMGIPRDWAPATFQEALGYRDAAE